MMKTINSISWNEALAVEGDIDVADSALFDPVEVATKIGPNVHIVHCIQGEGPYGEAYAVDTAEIFFVVKQSEGEYQLISLADIALDCKYRNTYLKMLSI